MTTYIDAVALVIDGARESADVVGLLEQNRFDFRVTLKLERRGQPCRAGADDNGDRLLFVFSIVAS